MSNLAIFAYSLLGLFVGGFLNALADILPRRESPGVPMCASCGKILSWKNWLALPSYVLTRGRCIHCGSHLSLRRLITELATTLLFAFLWQRYGPSIRLFFETLYTAILILLFIIDLEHRLILHATTLPAIALAVAGSFFLDRESYTWRLALLGGTVGLLIVLGMYYFGRLFVRVVERMRGQEIGEVAFGFGDVMLMTFIGIVVGFPNIIFALLLGTLLGGVGGAIYWLIKAVVRREYSLFTAIPYGPFLITAGWIFMIWGGEFLAWYFGG